MLGLNPNGRTVTYPVSLQNKASQAYRTHTGSGGAYPDTVPVEISVLINEKRGMTHRTSRISISVLLVCLAISLFCVLYPVYVIRPFRAQGARELKLALIVTQLRPLLTMFSAGTALLALAGFRYQRPRTWRLFLGLAGAVIVGVLAVLARVNVYEIMFHPIEHSTFTAATQGKLDSDEKVIAVLINGQSRAYPIRAMAYHHLLNDVVGGVAIVATY